MLLVWEPYLRIIALSRGTEQEQKEKEGKQAIDREY